MTAGEKARVCCHDPVINDFSIPRTSSALSGAPIHGLGAIKPRPGGSPELNPTLSECVAPETGHARRPACPVRTSAYTQHGGGGASTSLGLIALRPSPQVNLLKSIGPSVAFSLCAQRLRLQKSS